MRLPVMEVGLNLCGVIGWLLVGQVAAAQQLPAAAAADAQPQTEQAQAWPADSWPQWGGPERNHQSKASGLLQQWPEGGPPLAWKFTDAGAGYSSFAVHDGLLYTLGTADDHNFALCLNANDGSQVWRTRIGPAVREEEYLQGWGGGPRSTPTLTASRVFVLDDGGYLCCLERATGILHWRVNLVEDFGGAIPKWGYSESPLVDEQRVIVCPGNRNFLIALDVESGRLLMTSSGFDEKAHYVSVVRQTVAGQAMYVTAAQSGLVGFSATTGQALWTNSSSGNATATIPTPIIKEDLVYHTSAYSTGCVLLRVAATDQGMQAEEIYFNKNMQNHHGGVLLIDDTIFGYRRNGGWLCQDFTSGEILWSQRVPGDSSASAIYADHRCYVFGESSGTCYLVEPSRTQWLEHGQLTLPSQTEMNRRSGKIWAHPVVAEGKLFLRDMNLIFAFDIRQPK